MPLLPRGTAFPALVLLLNGILLAGCVEPPDGERDADVGVEAPAPIGAEEERTAQEVQVEIQEEYARETAALAEEPAVAQAFRLIEELEPWTMENVVTITEIPAPPFMEDERAEAFLEMLREVGVDEAYRDEEGNVIGVRRGTVGDRLLVLSGHLDTVFPEGTDVTVRFRGDTLFAPGVADDSRGMALVLTVLRAMNEAGIQTEADVWFVGTVGEEGLGDLRGVKHLFREGGPEIDAFISVDGSGDDRIVNQALGSRRYRVTFHGPGGHSWGAFGLGNPAHALGRAIERFDEAAAGFVAEGPRTSYNVGRIGGGTSVNSIPFEAWMEVDMRSIDQERLAGIDALFVETVQEALDEQNRRLLDGPALEVELDQVGDRPSGEIDPSTPFVQRALAAVSHFGFEPVLERSSTDSNVPISLGIPSVTVGHGGSGGGAHSLDEWWVNEDGHLAIQRTLLLVVAEAGLAGRD
jgi:tripeptide aminopeptidase